MPHTSARTALLAAARLACLAACSACAEAPSGLVSAPVASATPSAAPAASPTVSAASSAPTATDPSLVAPHDPNSAMAGGASVGPDASDAGAPARFRSCKADADCVAVPRVGCCHNGWNEAVAASQKDAYAASFTCPEAHPICAMFIVRDARVPACDGATHLCTLVARKP